VGGSLASSIYGFPRSTLDADIVARLRPEHIPSLLAALGDEFYMDAASARDAIHRRSSFNLIHLGTMFKVDIFIAAASPWAREEFSRRRLEPLGPQEDATQLALASPEDIILHKLDWYRQGGSVSDRQWNDVLGVLKVQGAALDFDYMRQWAAELGLTELLARAIEEAGIDPTGDSKCGE
jgi:hypothetical protein